MLKQRISLQPTHTKCPLCNDFDFLENSKLKVHLSHFHDYKFAAAKTSTIPSKKTVSGPNATATANSGIPLAFSSDDSDSPYVRFSPSKTPEILSASPKSTRRILWDSALLSPRKMSLKKQDICVVGRPRKSSLPVLLSSSPASNTAALRTPTSTLRSASASASAASTSPLPTLQHRSKSGISKKRLYFMESSTLSGHLSSRSRSPPLPFTSPIVSITTAASASSSSPPSSFAKSPVIASLDPASAAKPSLIFQTPSPQKPGRSTRTRSLQTHFLSLAASPVSSTTEESVTLESPTSTRGSPMSLQSTSPAHNTIRLVVAKVAVMKMKNWRNLSMLNLDLNLDARLGGS